MVNTEARQKVLITHVFFLLILISPGNEEEEEGENKER